MDKVFAYAGTRNIYEQMYVCLTSLLRINRADRVYLLIEDDEFPYPFPANVIVKNVSGQLYFSQDGPNYKSRWSYMSMLRCVFGKMFPDEKRILWLDCDTIVLRNISELFSMDMDGHTYAGVVEPKKSCGIFSYINTGVLLCNLDYIRELGIEEHMIQELNRKKHAFPDQDVINLFNQPYILKIPSSYNFSCCSEPCENPKILHFAAEKNFHNHKAWIENEERAFSQPKQAL